MKRDMDLIRQLMLEVECRESFEEWWKREQQLDQREIYHFLLLVEAELLKGIVVQECDGGELMFQFTTMPRLTWRGHEFLDSARNDTIWAAAKAKLGKAFESISFSALSQLLVKITLDSYGA